MTENRRQKTDYRIRKIDDRGKWTEDSAAAASLIKKDFGFAEYYTSPAGWPDKLFGNEVSYKHVEDSLYSAVSVF
jgi:hypothetical protein